MPAFLYVAKNKRGRTVKGQIEAPDEKLALAFLKKRNLTVQKLKKKPKDLSESLPFLKPKITRKDVVIFTRQFSTMITSGLPLLQGLKILSDQCENPTFKEVLKDISGSVEGGTSLGEAMEKYPAVFDPLYTNLVKAGELGGVLDKTLKRLADHMEKAEKLKAKVKGAMVYPIVVIAVAIIVIAVIMIFVIPVFEKMFGEMGAQLPAPTVVVISISRFVKGNIHFIIAGIVLLLFLFKTYRKTKNGRRTTDALSLKLPIFGILLKKVAVARFTRTLGTMLASGVPILDSLAIVAKTTGNVILEEIILDVRQSVAEGQGIAPPLSETDVFPPMVVQMIAVGEATGALDSMLEKIADFYDEEVDAAVAALTSMMEPLLMVFLGTTIGGLVISMYLPIFKMAGLIAG
ncbi:MAG: type II secretion system F family protein [Desulfatiglandales bacterium]